jgi:hypothetical protein
MLLKHFTIQVVLAMTVLVAANILFQRLSRNSVPRALLRTAEQSKPATDLFFGNSTMAAGLDNQAFAAAKPNSQPVNLGMGSSSSVEHYLIFRQQLKHQSSAVYYGFFDTQLTDPAEGDWGTLVGNRSMSYYIEPETAIRFYAPDSPAKATTLRLVSLVPILAERYTIWSKVELLRRSFGEVGMPKKKSNQFGRVEDFALLESPKAEFIARCQQATSLRTPFSSPISAMFQRVRASGRKLYVIEMPLPMSHRQGFYRYSEWLAYRAHIMKLVTETGGIYVSASDWIGEDGFSDHLHLSPTGAKTFSTRLARWVLNNE